MTRKTQGDIRLYHVDHLGSTSLVTDIDGEITQHVAYIPYGEVFVEQRNGSWNTPYLFNAKELDEETGLYYYGARYLDPTHAAWLSVDPLFEKYVGMTPYNYCAGNPVKLVDVDGLYSSEEEANVALKSNESIRYGKIIECAKGEWCVQETYKDGTPTGYYLRGPQDYIKVTPGTMTGKCQYQAWAARDESLLPKITPTMGAFEIMVKREMQKDKMSYQGAVSMIHTLKKADALSISLSLDAFGGGGGGAELEWGLIKGDGPFGGLTLRGGGGGDLGITLSLNYSVYSGDITERNRNTYSGGGVFMDQSLFCTSCGISCSSDRRWTTYSFGFTLGPWALGWSGGSKYTWTTK